MSYGISDHYAAHAESRSIDCKVVLMGNTGVGKTSLLQRYTRNTFDPITTLSTTGALFVTKKVHMNGLKVRLQLWDTAGQERFRSMAPMYYRGAHAALLLYDITSVASFEDVKGWLEELKKNAANDLIIYIVGSKADLIQYRQVTEDRARLSLYTWFPRAPTPPPVEPPEHPSTFSYIRPRFTSLTSSRSVPFTSSFIKSSVSPPSESDPISRASQLRRSRTGLANGRAHHGVPLERHYIVGLSGPASPTTASLSDPHSPTSHALPFMGRGIGFPRGDTKFPVEEEEEDNETSWGLEKDMKLFEVSAKDDRGVERLFDSLIAAIIAKRSEIRDTEWQHRNSIILKDPATPAWGVVAEEEAVRQRETSRNGCCS